VSLDLVGPVAARFLAGFGADAARVIRHGPLDDQLLASVLESADVLVHPAVGEAFGLVPFEASLAGIAAVVAGGHGCGEWFTRAGGCVVPPDEPGALLGAVGERLRDADLRKGESAAVAAFARRELTWPQVAARVAAQYDAAASGTAARAVLAG
jgi:glycosyltransferase involved in cell wall biosynthesis